MLLWLSFSLLMQALAQDGTPACQRLTSCPTGWAHYRPTNKCFYVQTTYLPISFFSFETVCQWVHARPVCDGHLAQISNAAENEFIKNLARSKMFPRGMRTITDLAAGLRASVWIGYRIPGRVDYIKKHEFRWVDGSPNQFTNWVPATPGRTEWYFAKQPDNGPEENCVVMSLGSGTWADVACNDGAKTIGGAVCQIRLPGTPAPVPLGQG